MFESLSERLEGVFKKIKGQGRLDENNIQEGLREVRLALLEADVNFKVVKDFMGQVRERATGQEVLSSLTPGQQVIKIVNEELVDLLGGTYEGLDLQGAPPQVIMLVGLQGSGKTTSAAKLALYLRRQKKTTYLVPADVYRPAAIDQLHKLAAELDISAFASNSQMDPVDICEQAIQEAKNAFADVVILDTAGRLHIDETLMQELADIKEKCQPREILLVADAMTGQDAVNVAASFNELLDLSGVLLTKMEGDARGGAALSIKHIIQKPIKFIGVGEKLSDLEVFYPDRVASRILGMGDMLTLIEKAQQDYDEKEARTLEKKLQKAEFDLEDFRIQMRRMRKLGSVESLLKMIPGMGKIKDQLKDVQMPEKELSKLDAIISSMTKEEKSRPRIINNSRKERIARGSGNSIQDVNQLLKNFTQMQKMLKKMSTKGKTKGAALPDFAQGMEPGMGDALAGAGSKGTNTSATKKQAKPRKKKNKVKRKKK